MGFHRFFSVLFHRFFHRHLVDWGYDPNFVKLHSYTDSFRSGYFDQITQIILMPRFGDNKIEILDRSLNFICSINISNPHHIVEHKDHYYVVCSTPNVVRVLTKNNETIDKSEKLTI